MSINEIDTKLISLGTGLLNKVNYDITFKYSRFDFLSMKFNKTRLNKIILSNNIYKRL